MRRSRRGKVQQVEEAEVNLTPMLDVVFIMLIFFIVTTSFVTETGIDISRPAASSAQAQTGNNVLVAINKDGEIWMNKQRFTLASIGTEVAKTQAKLPNSKVVLQADKDAPTGRLIAVMDKLRLAGVEQMAVATSNEK